MNLNELNKILGEAPTCLIFNRGIVRIRFSAVNNIIGIDCKQCRIARIIKKTDLTMSEFSLFPLNKKDDILSVKALPSGGLHVHCNNCDSKISLTHYNITKKLISADRNLGP